MADINVVQEDNGKRVELTLADIVVIHLPENPTTGYRWMMESNNSSTLETSEYISALFGDIGSGGQRIFKLRPTQNGASLIKFKHWREWEGDASVKGRFHFHMKVI